MNELAKEVVALFKEKGLTLGSVESMTAGLFGATLCEAPGASKVYLGGAITYSPKIKEALVGVPAELIKEKGVVSKEVALKMAEGGRKTLLTDIAISITGNAGPTAEPGEAEVGDTYIGVATEKETKVYFRKFKGERNEIRKGAVEEMMKILIEEIKNF